MILIVTLFVALAFSSNCDPSEEGGDGTFKFVGTVLPRGNYRIFVRTLPSKEMEKIIRLYDSQIVESKKAWNALELISDLKWKKFNFENAFGVLGDGTITDGTKFEIKLDWKKAHDPDLARESDPIYVQIYAVKESKKTSLVERILFNPSPEVEYEFIYGTPRDQIGVKKFFLGHFPHGTKNMETYVNIQPYANSNGIYQIADKDGNFEFVFAKDVTPPKEFKLLVYQVRQLRNTDVPLFTQKMTNPILIQMVENREDMSRYRYKFGNYEAENDEFGLEGEKEKMVSLYQAYLERTNIKLQKESSPIYKIPDEIDAYKLSLQMVHIKPLALKKN
uniref:Lipoprotein n=1 Tax=Globodera pallida TaxID=36090 RepID=A0A183CHH2_GLOPA